MAEAVPRGGALLALPLGPLLEGVAGGGRRLSLCVRLLQKALELETGNVVLSPTSIKTTLAMLFEGADGKSADEISSALRLDRLSRTKQEDKLHTFQKNLTTVSSAFILTSEF